MFGIKRTQADSLFSDIVRYRANWQCEYCHRQYEKGSKLGGGGLDCSHYWSRRNRSVRFDFENAVALCRGCHRKLGENPALHTEFFIKRLGQEKHDALGVRARTPAKFNEKDLIPGFKLELADLKSDGVYKKSFLE